MSVQNILEALVRNLSENGISKVVISPGSRNAPVIRAFQSCTAMQLFSAIDERSAAFQALGMAIAGNEPVVLLCTSGTALLNYYPALTEAFYSDIPLIAISADRPIESIDNWEGQCIRQQHVFENHLGKSIIVDPAIHSYEQITNTWQEMYEQLALKKPVHVNIPLNEPLYNMMNTLEYVTFEVNRIEGNVVTELPAAFFNDVENAEKILFIHGCSTARVHNTITGAVNFSDVLSNKPAPKAFGFWDAFYLKAKADDLAKLEPDLIISTGSSVVSKALRNWLASTAPCRQWHIGTQHIIGNPFKKDLKIVTADERLLWQNPLPVKQMDYLNVWEKLIEPTEKQFYESIGATFNEPGIFYNLKNKMPDNMNIHLANSSVVRMAAWAGWGALPNLKFGNRGTSGIDGSSSTAMGFAKVSATANLLITGDVAFFYDINAFWGNGNLPDNLKIVLINNNGGGIFTMINGPKNFPDSLKYQTTPHGRSAELFCKDIRMGYLKADNYADLTKQFDVLIKQNGIVLLEVFVNPDDTAKFFTQFKNS